MRCRATGPRGLLARLLVVLVAAAAGACARAAPVPAQAIEDAQLGVRVKTALVNDPHLGPRVIEVRVSGGIASLAGLVASEAERARALEIARAVPGIVDVESRLVIGEPPPPPQHDEAALPRPRDRMAESSASERRLLAVGLAVGGRRPAEAALSSTTVVTPMARIGRPRGFFPDVGFTWYQTRLSPADMDGGLGRITVRPVMGGIGYTLTDDVHWAMTFSVVGGVAFNGVRIDHPRPGDGQVVDIDNSPAVRPGASLWYDVNDRIALNVFGGYVITRPRTTFLEGGAFTRRAIRADAAVFSVGMAWKLF